MDSRKAPSEWPRKGVLLSLAAAAVLLAVSLVEVPIANADTFYNCTGHCYSTGDQYSSYSGIEGQWHDQPLGLPNSEVDNGSHLSNEMWLLTGADSHGQVQWIEEGLARGCSVYLGCGLVYSGGSNSYMQFWGDADQSSPQNFFFHLIGTLSEDGNNHVYEVWDSSNGGNNNYDVYLDYNKVGTSTDQEVSSGTQVQAGMELYSTAGINSNETAGNNFDNYIQGYTNSGGTWNYVNWSSSTSHSDTCNTTDQKNCGMDDCSSFMTGQCLYWHRASNYEWQDRKPT